MILEIGQGVKGREAKAAFEDMLAHLGNTAPQLRKTFLSNLISEEIE